MIIKHLTSLLFHSAGRLCLALFFCLCAFRSHGQGTAFTYQGRLSENGVPANGSNDLRFVLFDAPTNGSQISTNLTFEDVLLANGLFTVTLDWGTGVFDGGERWLEIRVRPGNAGGPFDTLAPRQKLTATPYAQRAATALSATSAASLNGSLVASQLTGTIADARLSTNVSLLGNNIDSTEIVNGTIQNVDIAADANIADTKLATINAPGKVANAATTATSANSPSSIVQRNGSGDFSAGTITANLAGHATTATTATNLAGNVTDSQLPANIARLNTNAMFSGDLAGQRLNIGNNHLLTGNLAGIGAGNGNTNQALRAFVAGGLNNWIQTNSGGSFIGGGQVNVVQSNSVSGVIGGGEGNTIATNASWAVIPGGRENTAASDYSLAAGRRAKANHSGNFVWADAQNADFASTGANTYIVRAQNGVGINTNDPAGAALNVNGAVRAASLEGALAASQLTGNIADARLSANVSLLGNNIDSSEIVNGTIMNVDINAAANIADTKLATINAAGKVANSATTATSANTPNAIVARDASGDFSAGTITGNFVGSGAGLTNVSLLAASPAWAITLTTNSGTFGFTLTSAPLVGEFPRGVVAVDFNGDGKPDLASANSALNTVTVLTNNGTGAFMLSATLPVGTVPRSLVAADLNGDGKADLVTANSDANSLSVLTNGGGGGFALASSVIVSTFPTCVRAADVNGDGSIDLIVSYTSQTSLTILTNNGTGGFTALAPQSVGRTTTAMAVAELNGDGAMDLLCVVSTVPGTLTVLLGTGNGTFVVHGTNAVGNGPNSPFCLIAADINSDGKPDAVCANATDDTLTVLTNNGAGTFGLRAIVSTGDSPLAVHAADMNGDGRVDLMTANSQANTASVLTNNGSGGFSLAVSPGTGLAPVSLTTADVNGDGAVDLCVANQSDDTISILQNSLPTVTTSASFQGNFNAPTLTVNGPLTAAGLLALGQSSFSASAGSTLTPATSHVQIFPNVLASVTLNTTTAIANGTDVGQVLILKGAGVFTVTVPDNANTQLQADRALGSGDTLFLLWDGSDWAEVSYSNN